MKNKKINSNIILFLICCFLIGCNNTKNNAINNNAKDEFINDINIITEFIQKISSDVMLPNNMNMYVVDGKSLIYQNLENEFVKYDLTSKNNSFGLIFENEKHEFYVTMQNDKYCAVKGFLDNNLSVYSLSERNKCHKTYVNGEKLTVDITGIYLENNYNYYFGEVANGIISLNAVSNLLDCYNCTYKWYRNGEEIENSNVSSYVITSDFEDANYSVEITTDDGQKTISNPVNVKISK